MSLVFRDRLASDDDFIFDSWVSRFVKSYDTGPIPFDLCCRVYRKVIALLLASPKVRTVVAVSPELGESFEIHGYVVFELGPHQDGEVAVKHAGEHHRAARMVDAPAIHFLYTKETRRRAGLAGSLLRAAGIDPSKRFFFTFRTPVAKEILRARVLQGKYHPNIVKYAKYQENATGELR